MAMLLQSAERVFWQRASSWTVYLQITAAQPVDSTQHHRMLYVAAADVAGPS